LGEEAGGLSQVKAMAPGSGNPGTMRWLVTLLSRLVNASEWRDIASAPFDREIELAVMDGNVGALVRCVRHGDGWLDAETLRPIKVTATHWRFRPLAFLPMSCC
jgi:hypothetical protein